MSEFPSTWGQAHVGVRREAGFEVSDVEVGIQVWGLGFGVQGSGFRVKGLSFRAQG